MKNVIYSIFLFLSLNSFGQFDELRQADFLMEKKAYQEAVAIYSSFLEKHPKDATVYLKVAKCHLSLLDEESAKKPLFKAFELVKRPTFEMYLARGSFYQFKHKFTQALKDYKRLPSTPQTGKRRNECKVGLQLLKNPIEIEMKLLEVNSIQNDVLPKVTADNKQLFFSSYRKGATGGTVYPMDIYVSKKEKNKWGDVIQLQKPINTRYNEACVGLSADGHRMFLYRGDNGGDLFIADFRGGKWNEPIPFPFNTKAKESSMTISPNGQEMLFIRREKGRMSKIYVSKLTKDSIWSEPKVFELDTPYDEETPFFHSDGQTVFFSSKGKGTMGGYDVFYSRRINGGWSEPKNVGFPLSTAKDELGFVLSANGEEAYYSSYRKGGVGKQDIYEISMAENFFNFQMILLSGIIENDKNEPLEADITVVDLESQKELTVVYSSKKSGLYLLPLENGRSYALRAEKSGYVFYSKHIQIPRENGYQNQVLNIVLYKQAQERNTVLNNVFFRSGESELDKTSINELLHLVELLTKNNKLIIEIIGHTDNVGQDVTNLALSQQRADNVKKFIISKGVSERRVKTKGFGSKRPIASNKTQEGRLKNRRIEFKLLK